ncbi:hypothetical protein SRABI03_02603 [Microbacterium foliorum]|nr:hypothetical protein SRABI03_02603 [Microbacterium foliorum]
MTRIPPNHRTSITASDGLPASPSSARIAARSSWLPMAHTTSQPSASTAGSTISLNRRYDDASPRSARSPVNSNASGRNPESTKRDSTEARFASASAPLP